MELVKILLKYLVNRCGLPLLFPFEEKGPLKIHHKFDIGIKIADNVAETS